MLDGTVTIRSRYKNERTTVSFIPIKVISCCGDDLAFASEEESYKLSIFLWTNRDSFEYVQVNVSLFETNSSLYYTSPSIYDPNCQPETKKDYIFTFNDFQYTSVGLINYKYIYEDYPNILCPLSVYNTTIYLSAETPLTQASVFQTGKKSLNLLIRFH